MIPFLTGVAKHHRLWRDVRAVEGGGLENR